MKKTVWERSLYSGHRVIEAALEKLAMNLSGFPYDDVGRTRSQLETVQFFAAYAEPGYSHEGRGIVLGNCNTTLRFVPRPAVDDVKAVAEWQEYEERHKLARKKSLIARVFKALERLGYEFEWEDEWSDCSSCGKLIRTNPNGYGWRRYYYETDDCDRICGDCVQSDDSECQRYLEWLEGSYTRAMTFDLDLAKLGYVHNEARFEHGFHHGQDADPKKVAEELKRRGINRFIFELDSVGQFDMDFSFWVHESEQHLMAQLDLSDAVVNGPSVSQAMMRGLQNASQASASLPDIPGTVKYAQVQADGSAAASLIPGAEFVEHGIKLAEQRIQACLHPT